MTCTQPRGVAMRRRLWTTGSARVLLDMQAGGAKCS